ncbi:hypothetical protein F9C07_6669 [Aspergillus flavus]|uniref:Uncharacterized protein n=1 Tax=Aspergillus flavus (strain ATCC 200026 / FGSC A1120 / IAM 13836 / NRRL 3357 / JCM 12722 / SRRC 167) TaxID=332952 RepID=A0A7U2MHD2_ASPFN|nr:hypothetical protein F9C07_6669 [Aspergillus flavus]
MFMQRNERSQVHRQMRKMDHGGKAVFSYPIFFLICSWLCSFIHACFLFLWTLRGASAIGSCTVILSSLNPAPF